MSTQRSKIAAAVIAVVSASAAIFHMYAAGYSPFTALAS